MENRLSELIWQRETLKSMLQEKQLPLAELVIRDTLQEVEEKIRNVHNQESI